MRLWFFFFALLWCPCYGAGEKALSQLQLDSVQFSEADLPSVLTFLGQKARELNGKPSNFVLYDPEGSLAKENPKISISLSAIPFSQVFQYVTQLSRTGYLIDKRVVWIGRPEDLKILKARRASRTSKVLATPAFARLARTRVPDIDFSDTSLTEALEGLRQIDRAKNGPGNFVLIPGDSIDPSTVKINMKVSGVSLAELTQFTAELSGFQIRVDGKAIVFRDPEAHRHPSPRPSRLLTYLGTKVVEQVSLVETSIPEMIDFIRHHSKSASLPNGINVVQLSNSTKTVTLDLKGARLSDILRYMNEQTDTSFTVEHNAIQIIDIRKR